MIRRAFAPLLLATAALSACATMEPKYHRPDAPVPAAFPSVTGDAPPVGSVTWDAFFIDPKLKTVITRALQENRDLRQSLANIQIARARYRVERSTLFPALNGQAQPVYGHTGDYGVVQQGAHTSTGTNTPTSGAGSTSGGTISSVQGKGDYRYYSVGLGVSSYELDLFGRVRSLTKEAFENYLSTTEAARAARVTLVAETASDYLTLAADRQRLRVTVDTLKADQAIYDIALARFNGGIASELDVRQAQTALEQAKSDLATLTATAAQDLDALNLVVGASLGEDLLPQGLDDTLPTVADAPTGLSSAVLLDRPDVLQAEHTLKAYNADIGAARADFFPRIMLSGSGGTTTLYIDKLFAPGTGTWSFAPSVTLPIFDGGQRRANLSLARAEREGAVAAYEKAVQAAFRDVADALAQRGVIGDQIGAQERLTEAAAVTLQLSQARYQRGADTYLNTLDAQRTLYAAQQSLVVTRATRALNLVALYRALGGGRDAGTAFATR